MFNNILFVCIGNICRSPSAEYLLKHKTAHRPGLTIHSAGLGALVDQGIDATAGELLTANGIDASEHVARKLTRDMLVNLRNLRTLRVDDISVPRADIAAVDAVTWRLIQRHDPHAARLREIGRTAPTTPALPFITGRGQDAPRIRKALADAIAALAPAERDALSLYGVVQIAKAEYRAVPNPPPPRDAARH